MGGSKGAAGRAMAFVLGVFSQAGRVGEQEKKRLAAATGVEVFNDCAGSGGGGGGGQGGTSSPVSPASPAGDAGVSACASPESRGVARAKRAAEVRSALAATDRLSGKLGKVSFPDPPPPEHPSKLVPGSPGELALAIQEKVLKKAQATMALAADPNGGGAAPGSSGAGSGGAAASAAGAAAARSGGQFPQEAAQPQVQEQAPLTLTAAFAARGMEDAGYTSKFTASHDTMGLNRRGEQRPDTCWYKVQYGQVLSRPPAWDFSGHETGTSTGAGGSAGGSGGAVGSSASAPALLPPPRGGGAGRASLGGAARAAAFLTGVDGEDFDDSALTARQRATLGLSPASANRRANGRRGSPQKEQMCLQGPRGPIGKVGRIHVLANEHSYPAADLYQQDIKGYPKQRYPHWNFEKQEGRKPLIREDGLSEPGKYNVLWDRVSPVTRQGVTFDKALKRDVHVATLGYIAPPAVLHADTTRYPGGCAPDRSLSKNSVRHRMVHVNNFDKELPRKRLSRNLVYHNVDDPAACEQVYWQEYSYDADVADRYVTHRRDAAPGYAQMLSRSREAVQGNRAVQNDPGILGSVGIGFVETRSQREHSVETVESRRADGRRERPDISVHSFDTTTQFQHTVTSYKLTRGKYPVKGATPNSRGSPLKSCSMPNFSRRAPMPGFHARISRQPGQQLAAPRRTAGGAAPHRRGSRSEAAMTRIWDDWPDGGSGAAEDGEEEEEGEERPPLLATAAAAEGG